jgi:hypothetical protein
LRRRVVMLFFELRNKLLPGCFGAGVISALWALECSRRRFFNLGGDRDVGKVAGRIDLVSNKLSGIVEA